MEFSQILAHLTNPAAARPRRRHPRGTRLAARRPRRVVSGQPTRFQHRIIYFPITLYPPPKADARHSGACTYGPGRPGVRPALAQNIPSCMGGDARDMNRRHHAPPMRPSGGAAANTSQSLPSSAPSTASMPLAHAAPSERALLCERRRRLHVDADIRVELAPRTWHGAIGLAPVRLQHVRAATVPATKSKWASGRVGAP